MGLIQRTYAGEDDFWRLRAFLREVFLLNDRRERSWQTLRLDYWRWHGIENCHAPSLEDGLFLWETQDGRLAAALNPENHGEAHFQVHPAYRLPELEAELLETAERRLARITADGDRSLTVWCGARETERRALLERRGYERGSHVEHQHARPLTGPISPGPLPAGYTLRALGGPEELPARSWASWRAFHPDAPDSKYEGWEWYHSIQRMPLYRRDLDLVAIAPDGSVAAFATVWLDDVTRTGCFEPVGVVPEHQRRGLGQAVLSEGLRRLQGVGGTLGTVAGYSPAAIGLYGQLFGEVELCEPWMRKWK